MHFYKSRHNLETKHPLTLAPLLWRPGDVVSSDDLPQHDIERLTKNRDLLPLSLDEAKRDMERAKTWHESLLFRKSKNLHVDPQLFAQVECRLKATTDVVKAIAG
jgi:hypothetical protein